jgi:DNA-binding NarL/FixJ family response regulator
VREGPSEPVDSGSGRARPTTRFELTALVCGEQPLVVKSLTRILQEEAPGIRFAGAGSLEEGARLAGELKPDAILLNADVPGSATADAIRFFRSSCGSGRLLVLAPDCDEDHAREALVAGASAYLAREGDVRTVVAAIRMICSGLAVMPARIAESLSAAASRPSGVVLTRAQQEILVGIACGQSNRQLAASLHVSERTVARRLQELYDLLRVEGRREAAEHARRYGLVEEESIAR